MLAGETHTQIIAKCFFNPLGAIWFLYNIGHVLLYRKRTSSAKVRLRDSYAEDRGWIPGRLAFLLFSLFFFFLFFTYELLMTASRAQRVKVWVVRLRIITDSPSQ